MAVNTIKKNAAYNIVLAVSQLLFPIFIFPYVSRILGPGGMGSIGFVESFTQYFVMMAALGIPVYGVREIAKYKHDYTIRSKIFSEIILIHSLATVVLTIVYILIFMTIGELNAYRRLFTISVGIMIVQVFTMEWLFQGVEQFKLITIRGVFSKLLSIILIYLFVNEANDVTIYYFIVFFGGLASMLINIYYARNIITLTFFNLKLKRHLKPMLFIFSFSLVIHVYTVFDTVILGFIKDDVEVGYYSTSIKLSRLIITVLTAVTMVMIPQLSKQFHEQNHGQIKALLTKSFSYVSLFSIPIVTGLMLYAGEIIILFAGNEFMPATYALQIIAPTVAVIGYSNIFGMQILNPSNNERLFFKAAVTGMIVSLIANFTLVPRFGYIGSSIAAFVAEFIVLILLARFAIRIINFAPDWSLPIKAWVSSLIFIPIYYLIRYANLNAIVALFSGVLLSALFYFFIQYWIWRNAIILDMLTTVSRIINRVKRKYEA
ncbi:flippase [Parapedobacter koreensis]|uniref:Membrane protein involved in the export of O-antigen and teichoic acid n=1 Tax=Parapedobacter koreensis TaxID=332977 RepID=A0A1H7RGS0_9SPHI|nr:flippase [Parapedobacter koreensis]SEL59305.1 Membrane protein involved in the export of O-antigen and teichoic acid [Parapedobacter koreensis]